MLKFLRKLFIKDYENLNNTEVRANHGKLAAGFGVFTNTILFVLKLIFGLLTASISIIGDSINNLSDMATSVITLVGFKISSKPADKEHPFGHQRIEYIAGLIVSVIIVALACILFYTSIQKIISYFSNPTENNSSLTIMIWSFSILGFAVLLKIFQGIFYYKMSKLIHSVSLKASAIDSFTDSIATSCVLIASLLGYFLGWSFLDGFMGVLVSIFVAFSGIKMIQETSNPLIGTSVDKELINKIIKDIQDRKGVLGIHDVMCHMYGPTKMFMSVHVEVDAHKDIIESHDLIDSIEMEIKKKYGVEIVIHMDPVDNNDPLTLEYREKTIEILKKISSELTLHDFRAVHGKTHTNLIFDIVVPFDIKMNNDEIKKILSTELNKDSDMKLNLVINFDRPFVD